MPTFATHSAPRVFACLALLLALTGCTSYRGVEAVVRPEFMTYDRVALWSSLPREIEDLFIPLYMQAFPNQVLVERRDVSAIIGEQDLLPERLNEETRAKLRRILGVKAIVFPSSTADGFAIKVIETETGAITASVFVDRKDKVGGKIPEQDLLRTAISALRHKASPYGATHEPDLRTSPLPAAPEPLTPQPAPNKPPPRD